MTRIERIVVGILAGGNSSRLEADKVNFHIAGRSLLEHLIHRTRKAGYPVVILGRQTSGPSDPSVKFLQDIVPGRGPLSGVHALLRHLSPSEIGFVMPCDLPFFDPAVIPALHQHRGEEWALLLEDGYGPQPVCGFYTRSCLPHVESCLRQNRRVVWALLDRVPHRFVRVDDLMETDPHLLFNLNTPSDVERFWRLYPERSRLFRLQVRRNPSG